MMQKTYIFTYTENSYIFDVFFDVVILVCQTSGGRPIKLVNLINYLTSKHINYLPYNSNKEKYEKNVKKNKLYLYCEKNNITVCFLRKFPFIEIEKYKKN